MSETNGPPAAPAPLPPPPRGLTKAQFLLHARPVLVTVLGRELVANPMKFKTGSLGYHAAGKMEVAVGAGRAQVQVNVMLTVVHSRDLPEE